MPRFWRSVRVITGRKSPMQRFQCQNANYSVLGRQRDCCRQSGWKNRLISQLFVYLVRFFRRWWRKKFRRPINLRKTVFILALVSKYSTKSTMCIFGVKTIFYAVRLAAAIFVSSTKFSPVVFRSRSSFFQYCKKLTYFELVSYFCTAFFRCKYRFFCKLVFWGSDGTIRVFFLP